MGRQTRITFGRENPARGYRRHFDFAGVFTKNCCSEPINPISPWAGLCPYPLSLSMRHAHPHASKRRIFNLQGVGAWLIPGKVACFCGIWFKIGLGGTSYCCTGTDRWEG